MLSTVLPVLESGRGKLHVNKVMINVTRITNTDNFVYIPTQVCPLLKLFRIGRKAIKSALVAVVVVLTISSKALHHADNVNKHCSDPEVVSFQMAQCRGTGVLLLVYITVILYKL